MKCRLLRRRRAHLRVPSPGAAAIAAQLRAQIPCGGAGGRRPFLLGGLLIAGVGGAGPRRAFARDGEAIQELVGVAGEPAVHVVRRPAADAAHLVQRCWRELDAMHLVEVGAGLSGAHELRPATRLACGCLGKGALIQSNAVNLSHCRSVSRNH